MPRTSRLDCQHLLYSRTVIPSRVMVRDWCVKCGGLVEEVHGMDDRVRSRDPGEYRSGDSRLLADCEGVTGGDVLQGDSPGRD